MMNSPRRAAFLLLTAALAATSRAEILHQEIGPLRLRGLHTPMEGPRTVLPLRFPRAGWLRGFSARLVDAKGRSADDRAVFCHAAIRVRPPRADARFVGGVIGEPLHVTLSEGANSMSFPEGFGLYVDSSTNTEIEVKLQNEDLANEGDYVFRIDYDFAPLDSAPAVASLSVLAVPAGPTERRGDVPPLSWRLPKGKSRITSEFTMPYAGTIHYLAFHIHQYARSLTLLDAETGKTLYSGNVRNRPDGWPAETPVYSSAKGIPAAAGRKLLLRVDSDNTGPKPVDVMTLMRAYVRRADGR